jgi:hypothetical protein
MSAMIFVYDPFLREKRFLLLAGWLLSLRLCAHLWRWVLVALVPVTAGMGVLWRQWRWLVQCSPDLAPYPIITVTVGHGGALF